MSVVPEKMINFRAYNEAQDLLGIADVELPDIEAMTETVKGAGIAGEVESPVLGHFSSMTLKLNWRTLQVSPAALSQQKAHLLDLRGANQQYDSAEGAYKTSAIRVVAKCVPKKLALGKLDVGSTTDTSNEFEVNYIKITIDGEEVVEIDKFNYICKIKGTDFLADVRMALGLLY